MHEKRSPWDDDEYDNSYDERAHVIATALRRELKSRLDAVSRVELDRVELQAELRRQIVESSVSGNPARALYLNEMLLELVEDHYGRT